MVRMVVEREPVQWMDREGVVEEWMDGPQILTKTVSQK